MGGAHPKRFSLKKAHPQSYSQCITATNGSIGAANACHWDNRAFTVSEVKRIMSVPDDYVLTGTYQQQVERLGRMVAPLMMKAVADNLCNLGVFNADT
jgi:DNA (cytosine-5)-methyltransferase 1